MLKKKKNQEEQAPIEGTEPAAETVNQDELSKLTAELEKAKADAADANDRYLRLYAEFDNFKRRTTKERVELLQTAGKEVIVSMLPVVDDFERALRAMENATDITPVVEGVNLVNNKLKNVLQQKGLKEMVSKGETFDPDLHEAITNIPAPTDDLKGKVIDEVEKGYYLNDKVIRFAKVLVGA
ncbi:nucleotide exchange factor GrpE [Hufsiella ginkgonis]|uniref:Protein GrpE n=1 Tax=Hufsiella ginkgonis TaxID=2695274 RepID=A0A7K1XWC6_9SPHI|nr:nucleotide exchange factor GrpE [Hufsiella ginkgonis]MXV15127.1 nucleotide exchange factor GrpE [Hufsiella ginkgonis]